MKRIIIKIIILIIIIIGIIFTSYRLFNRSNKINVNINELTYKYNNNEEKIKVYNQEEFNNFLNDYNNNKLPDIYITNFLFDGVGMYKTYDLDDFIEEGNDVSVKVLNTTVININTNNVSLTGDIVGGMIAVNTNNINDDINITLNNVNIDTDSKKIPAIYVYNKDINYTDHKVTIKLQDNSKNIINGGKFKKVSLIAKEELDNYKDKYNNDYYKKYTNYYGVYTKEEINNILFAKVEADNEDLADGDPYYFYKGAGAISSDIDLYFEGNGYLEVTSKNKEGIETKGNLIIGDGSGDYKINALDDCLNTTSKGNDSRNQISINVNSLTAIVDKEADEGDAIDSNGTLEINNGTIIAIAKAGMDAGLDSEKGTYINGGVILATGDMLDEISKDSKQTFISLSFSNNVEEDSLITLLDSTDGPIFAYKTDRSYTKLIYSSNNISDGTYYLYQDGEITGNNNNGLYNRISSYNKGTLLGYSNNNEFMFNKPNGMEEPPNMKENNQERKEPPTKKDENQERKEIPNKEFNKDIMDMNPGGIKANNKEFIINGISNIFNGINKYEE